MRTKALFFVAILLMITAIPVSHAYTDPVSVTLIWQFLASALVGVLFFFKQIKLWVLKVFKNKNNK